MDLRDKLRKAAELFVELPEEEALEQNARAAPADGETDLDKCIMATQGAADSAGGDAAPSRTVEQIVREAEGPNLDEIEVSASAAPPTLTPDGKVDFSALYQQANLPATAFTAEQTLEMLTSLPTELPLEVKRRTVKVTLGAMGKALGATPETIVADASRKLAALAAYTEALSKQTAEFAAGAEFEIAALQGQIEEKRKASQAATQQQALVSHLCHEESDRLDDVLEFFSLDVAPSKYSEPGGGPPPSPS